MKNTIKKAIFNFLIYQKDNKFFGICKETGYVEEGKTPEEIHKLLVNGTKAIFETVKDNPGLLPSINQRPSFKYLVLFYWIPISYSFKNLFSISREIKTFDLTPVELCV